MRYFLKIFLFLILIKKIKNTYQCETKTDFFDDINTICRTCPLTKKKNPKNCICDETSKKKDITCEKCPKGEIPDFFKQKCLPKCENCETCKKQNEFILTNSYEGGTRIFTDCIKCDKSSFLNYVSINNKKRPFCDSCPYLSINLFNSEKCDCDSSQAVKKDDICVMNEKFDNLVREYQSFFDLGEVSKIQLFGLDDDFFISMDFFYKFEKNFFLCANEMVVKNCLSLYFQCALNLDNENSVCDLLFQINEKENFNLILKDDYFQENFFKVNNDDIEIYVREFNYDGEIIKTEIFNKNILNCNLEFNLNLKYGKNLDFTCENFKEINKNNFYQLLIKVDNNQFLEIPVINTNIKNDLTIEELLKEKKDKFFNKYFFHSFILQNNIPSLTRILKKFKLVFMIKQSDKKEIFVPLLILYYEDKSGIINNNELIKKKIEISFADKNENFRITFIIFFILLSILSLIISLFRIYIVYRNNFTKRDLKTLILEFLFKMLRTWSNIMLYFFICIWFFWLFFYKSSKSPTIIFPSSKIYPDSEKTPITIIILIILSNLIWIIWKIIRQSGLKIKIIDWEKPNLIKYEKERGEYKVVSSWRYLTFVNEFREEMTNLALSAGFILLCLNLFMIGFKFENFSRLHGNQVYYYKEIAFLEDSSFLRFFLIIILVLTMGIFSSVVSWVNGKFFGAGYENLIDLCSICNVSLVIFLQPNKVCYIHGKNNFGTGEGTLALIYKKLQLESTGNSKNRGILENDAHQVFEIIDHSSYKKNEKKENNLEKKDNTLNDHFFTQKNIFLEKIKEKVTNPNIVVKEKSFFSKLFGVFYKDNKNDFNNNGFLDGDIDIYKESNSYFSNFFLAGIWYDVLILIAWVVAIFDYYFESLTIGCLFGFFLGFLIIEMRNYLGVKNLVSNNKVDQRFLI